MKIIERLSEKILLLRLKFGLHEFKGLVNEYRSKLTMVNAQISILATKRIHIKKRLSILRDIKKEFLRELE